MPTSDLSVSKTVSNATPNVGDTITFTVTLSNQGPDPATNVQLTDLLPAGLTFVSATPTQGTYLPNTGLWDVGTVIAGTPQTLSIIATVVSPNALTNTGSISHADQVDPNTANNTASATETPQVADLSVSKMVSNATPNVGDTITFTVTLSDQGPDAATNVKLSDLLPAGLTFVGATPSQGTYNSATGIWDVGTLANGAQTVLTIGATVVSPGTQTNTAAISHADQFDPITANNSASATEAPPADLQVAITDGATTVVPGTGDTYMITVTNNGPDTVSSVTLTDTIPAALLNPIFGTPSAGSYDPGTRVWSGLSLASSQSVTITLTGTIDPSATGSLTNTVTVAGTADTNPGNNSATDVDTLTPQADLAITKTDGTASVAPGTPDTYTIVVSNNGPSTAVAAPVTDMFPAAITSVSWTPWPRPGPAWARPVASATSTPLSPCCPAAPPPTPRSPRSARRPPACSPTPRRWLRRPGWTPTPATTAPPTPTRYSQLQLLQLLLVLTLPFRNPASRSATMRPFLEDPIPPAVSYSC